MPERAASPSLGGAGPYEHLGGASRKWNAPAESQSALVSCSWRRVALGAHIGATRWATEAQTLGDPSLREEARILRRTRRRSRGCARTLFSHCRSRQTARPKEAFPPHASALKERKGVAVNGGLGTRMYESRANSCPLRRVLCDGSPTLRSYAWIGEPRATKS